MVERNKEWSLTAKELFKVMGDIKRMEAKKKEVRAELIKLSKNCDSSFEGYQFKQINRPGVISYNAIPELKEIDLEPYRLDPTSFWRLFKKY